MFNYLKLAIPTTNLAKKADFSKKDSARFKNIN